MIECRADPPYELNPQMLHVSVGICSYFILFLPFCQLQYRQCRHYHCYFLNVAFLVSLSRWTTINTDEIRRDEIRNSAEGARELKKLCPRRETIF